jgi:hypothetical protein
MSSRTRVGTKASRLSLVAFAALLWLIPGSSASAYDNPFVTHIFTADPGALVHDGTLFVYTGHDEAALGGNDFVMRDWHVFSSTDTVNWTNHGARMALTDFAWANRNAWAGDVVHRNGRFYWYVPVNKASTNSMSIGVAVGDTPLGPFHDALGRALIDNTTPNHSAFDIDPTVFVDDDGQAYIYWGSFSSPRAARLKSNMIELDDAGAAGGATGPRVAGRIGNAVKLNGTADYVSMPSGIVSTLNDFTIATWVNPAAISTWARIFDFGTGTASNMFLTVSAGSAPRFAITTSGGGGEQRLNGTTPLATNQWTHVAVTLSGTTGTLYVNGAPVATNTGMTLRPANLGVTNQNWIGRSQYSDPFLNATVDDFQIYDRALTATEVQTLAGGQQGTGNVASYRFDEASGATALDSSGNGRDATIVSPTVTVITPQGLTGFWEAPWLFKRNGLYYLAYARGNPTTGGNPATIDYATAGNPLGPWTYRGRILDTVNNTTTNHPAIIQLGDRWYIVYHNGMMPGGGEFRRSVSIDELFFNPDGTIQRVVQTLSSKAAGPVAWYRFDEDGGTTAVDSSGNGRDGTLASGASRAPGLCGSAVSLDGLAGHVSMPAGIVWNQYDFTFSVWVRLDPFALFGSRHVFNLGTGATVFMYLTPRSETGTVRFGIKPTASAAEQRIEGPTGSALPAGEWVHVAVTKSALVGRLYVNGVQVGQNTNLSTYPARLGNTGNNWIGRSQIPTDPNLAGLVDDFRIYQRGLSATEIQEAMDCSLDETPPVTTATLSPSAVNGWYSNPTVTLSATDQRSGVERSEYRLDGAQEWTTYTGPFPVSGDGEHTLEYRSVDRAGNVETAQTLGFRIDATKPTIAFEAPTDGAVYLLDASVAASYGCSDNLSGVASCEGSVAAGAALDTSSVGFHGFTVSAADQAGNQRVVTIAYQVVWPFAGFFAPIANPPTVNVVQAGTAVPVKFSLGGDYGLDIFAPGHPRSSTIECGSGRPENAVDDTATAGGSSLKFSDGRYVYTWKTDPAWAGSCRLLSVALIDGTVHTAVFRFK